MLVFRRAWSIGAWWSPHRIGEPGLIDGVTWRRKLSKAHRSSGIGISWVWQVVRLRACGSDGAVDVRVSWCKNSTLRTPHSQPDSTAGPELLASGEDIVRHIEIYFRLPQRRQQWGVRGVVERPSSVVTISAGYLRANSAGYPELAAPQVARMSDICKPRLWRRLWDVGCRTSRTTALSTYLTNRWLRSAEGAQQGSPFGRYQHGSAYAELYHMKCSLAQC